MKFISRYAKEFKAETEGEHKGVALVDIYSILWQYQVKSHPVGHAVKKLLMAGQRGHKDRLTDLREAAQAIQRAIELEEHGQ